MKLNNIELSFDNFASEMAKLKNEKHFDYLVTIIGEDFGEEGLGCIYILENTQTNERCSVKTIAKKVDGSDVIPTVINLWKVADLLEREVFDFVGIKFLGHPDMRRLFLRTDFQGYPLRKDFDMSPEANKFPCTDEPEDDFTVEYSLSEDGHLVAQAAKTTLTHRKLLLILSHLVVGTTEEFLNLYLTLQLHHTII